MLVIKCLDFFTRLNFKSDLYGKVLGFFQEKILENIFVPNLHFVVVSFCVAYNQANKSSKKLLIRSVLLVKKILIGTICYFIEYELSINETFNFPFSNSKFVRC